METALSCIRLSEVLCEAGFLSCGRPNVGHRKNETLKCSFRDGIRRSTNTERPLLHLFRHNWRQSALRLQSGVGKYSLSRRDGKRETVLVRAKSSPPDMLSPESLEQHCLINENTSKVIQESEYTLREVLVKLRNGGPGDGKIVCPPSMSAKDRRRAHEIAERLGLGHVSVGQGKQRCFTAWRLSAAERLTVFRKLLDVEEAASRASFALDQPLQSWKELEAQGILLHKASVVEKEAASFGRERWVLEDGIGSEREGHVSRFAQRARPGMAIRLAEKDPLGNWIVSEGQPPGRVTWSRGGKLCLVFDYPPNSSDEIREVCVLRVPDSTSFDKMRSVIGDCERAENGMKMLLNALLEEGIRCVSGSSPSNKLNRGASKVTTSTTTECQENDTEREQHFDKGLNAEQCAAVKLCTEDCESPVVLIHGPFGTGKTRTLVEVVLQQVKSGRRVLACAASNAAVDNLALALLTADPSIPLARAGVTERVASAVATHTLETLQDAQPEAAIAKRLRKEAYSMHLTAQKWTRAGDGGERRRKARKEVNALYKDARRLEQVCAASVLSRTKVLCGTLTGFASSLQDLGNSEDTHFDCVIVDEASQVITPALLLVLPHLKYPENFVNSSRSPLLVLAGDHQQLPPTVLSEDVDEKGGGLEATLFEELMERDGGGLGTRLEELVSSADSWDPAKVAILRQAHIIATGVDKAVQPVVQRSNMGSISAALRQQYRMPAQLMAFPSAAFYGAELVARHRAPESVVSESKEMFAILDRGLLLEVIDTAGAGFEEEKNGESSARHVRSSMALEIYSVSNSGQADLTARVVRELLRSHAHSAGDIGVVTPYSAQVTLLRELMAEEVKAGLEIDSVDAFQGREKNTIVLDTVRSNIDGTVGFLSDFHRLNVGITRARQKLVVIGDSATLSTDQIWALFFEWVSEYRDRPETRIRYRSVFELSDEDGW
ncbi:hypothetical protein MPTK1_7g14380 [Marchantia polymorpha subsp. ruderalis]|uniref:R3H domain-containing protein n=2 Tax=Marchantia polymorpha TaxID=3197 RepID=A0AAF6BZI6_MARPO|nr:hypothetical protein MARPO_0009s0123 [Marchantia polymorpha]BBN17420.1 hypothetical protein Mp_7g14380 [Marchantia polymorpha subsp. ruderalis]|eukprot:PTQ47024.1 hypothetical protein MARPO_0009s0123 [Marchantia polymorpha]